MNRVKIIIAFSLIVLIGLIVVSIFLANSGNKTNNIQKDSESSNFKESKGNRSTSQTLNEVKNTQILTKEQASKLLIETKNLPILTGKTADKNFELQAKTPYIAQDFELGYSDLTGKYYLYKKTPKADVELNKFLKENEYEALINSYNELFNEVNESVQRVIKEEEFKIVNFNSSIEKEKIEEAKTSNDYDIVREENRKNNLRVLSKLFTQLLSPSTGGTDQLSSFLSEEEEEATPSSEITLPQIPSPSNITLDGIFNEAGIRVGTPPKILRGVMTRECPPLVSLPNEKIIEYSLPGQGIPIGHGCYRNSIGASGPMQFLPDVWLSYASAVNKFGGYTHTPYIANMRDSVYGAAWKLKRDSQTSDLNWTYDQVRRAVICYNAGCGRLSNPPSSTLRYLEAVWNIYKS